MPSPQHPIREDFAAPVVALESTTVRPARASRTTSRDEIRHVMRSNPDRVQILERHIEALRAELAGLRSGVLSVIEGHDDSVSRGCTTKEIAAATGMSAPAVNNHCKRLVQAGLVDRVPLPVVGGGLSYGYRRRYG